MFAKHELHYAFDRPDGTGSVPAKSGLNGGVQNGVLHFIFMNPGDHFLFRESDQQLEQTWAEYQLTKPSG